MPIEVGCRGFIGRTTTSYLTRLGLTNRARRRATQQLQIAAERASSWIWSKVRKSTTVWQNSHPSSLLPYPPPPPPHTHTPRTPPPPPHPTLSPPSHPPPPTHPQPPTHPFPTTTFGARFHFHPSNLLMQHLLTLMISFEMLRSSMHHLDGLMQDCSSSIANAL